MTDRATNADRRQARVQRIAREAVREASASEGWQAYERAKQHVRREYGTHVPGYDAIIDEIKDRLEI